VTVSDWHNIPVCTLVEVNIDGDTFVGNIAESSRHVFYVLGLREPARRYRWPKAGQVTHEEPTRLRWTVNGATFTLTVRSEPRCAG
jgi:hypothetical protein